MRGEPEFQSGAAAPAPPPGRGAIRCSSGSSSSLISRMLDKAAFTFTGDAGCEFGGGVSCGVGITADLLSALRRWRYRFDARADFRTVHQPGPRALDLRDVGAGRPAVSRIASSADTARGVG